VLPYTLYEQEYMENKVAVTLQNSINGPTPYEFLTTAQTAPGQTKFGEFVITVILTEGYQPGKQMDWEERIGEQTGTGGLWEGETLDAQELMSNTAFGVGNSDEYPVAVFVRVVAGETGNFSEKYEDTVEKIKTIRYPIYERNAL
jgi:hypothetical protein